MAETYKMTKEQFTKQFKKDQDERIKKDKRAWYRKHMMLDKKVMYYE